MKLHIMQFTLTHLKKITKEIHVDEHDLLSRNVVKFGRGSLTFGGTHRLGLQRRIIGQAGGK
jgi:hypothetical protein